MKKNTLNIFLTGGTGLVGTQLLSALQMKNYNITVISRNIFSNTNCTKYIKFDILTDNIDKIIPHIREADIIIHNAACINSEKTEREIVEMRKVNFQFTNELFDLAVKSSVQKIIYTSGFNLIKKNTDIINEESEIEPETEYAKSKYFAESLLKRKCSENDINYNILRLSSPITNRLDLMPNTVVKKWINTSLNKEIIKVFGNGQRRQNFVHVSDIADAFIKCINMPKVNGIFNIASGSNISMLEMAQAISRKFGTSYEFEGEDEKGAENWNISIDKAKNMLGFEPKFSSLQALDDLIINI